MLQLPFPITQAMPALMRLGRAVRNRLAGAPAADICINHLVRYDRPAFLVRGGRCETPADDPWRPWLERRLLMRAIACIGRFTTSESPRLNMGTGWRVRPNVLVTNRHLALYFEERRRSGPVVVTIDFAGEHHGADRRETIVGDLLYAADDHDLAFLRLAPAARDARPCIELSAQACRPGMQVCTIGFPASNTLFYDPRQIDRIFRGIFDVKRVAPGEVLAVSDQRIDHDCTTLGGNSGSVLLDLATGRAVGLHADGIPFMRNHAVPAAVIRERLDLFCPNER